MCIAGRAASNELMRQFRSDKTSVFVLINFLLVDIAFITVHIVRGVMKEKGMNIGFIADPRFSLLRDQGYAELFNYSKLVIIIVLLLLVWKRSGGAAIYYVLAIIFAAILIDDSLSVHEAGGHLLLDWVGRHTRLGLHVRDLGELMTWAIVGSFALTLFVLAYRKSRPEDASIAAIFAGCLVLLTAFAIGFDMLHALAPTRALDGLFGIIEETGEIVVLSLTCALALFVFRHSRPSPRLAWAQPAA